MLLDGSATMAHMSAMLSLVRQLIRAGTTAVAIVLVLLATTGIHIHAHHDDHDHHHAAADHHHDHADDADHDDPIGGDPDGEDGADTDGHDGILFHAHGVLVDVISPQVGLALGADHQVTTANHRPSCDAVPDHPVRDIEPPPNKRVL